MQIYNMLIDSLLNSRRYNMLIVCICISIDTYILQHTFYISALFHI